MLSALVVLFVLLGEVAAAAQDAPVESNNEPARTLKAGKVLRATRIVAAPPAIDGSLADEVWTAADSAGDYIQRDPDNGAAMTEVTHIQVAYDDRYRRSGRSSSKTAAPSCRRITSVRGNLVLRWEYVRGSTFFLVWDMSQENSPPKHVLMAKVTYWLNR